MSHVTLKDIGKEVGVSVVTVSRALNDKPDISYGTKQKIREVAERLGYSPNALARREVKNPSKQLMLSATFNFFQRKAEKFYR